MSLVTLIAELWRFIKDNIWKILIGALTMALVTIGIRFLLNQRVEDAYFKTNEEITKEKVQESYDLLSEVYEQEPAEFSFIAMSEKDSDLLDNSFVIDEYLTRDDIVKEVEDKTGVEISDTLDAEENIGFEKTPDFRGGVAALRNTSTDEITLRVMVGKTAEDNLKVAKAYLEILENNDVPFLETFQLTPLTEVEIGENLPEDSLDKVPTQATLGTFQLAPSLSSYVMYGVLGFILGMFIVIAILFVIHLFSSKITYAFDYAWDFEDYHYLLNHKKESTAEIAEIANYPQELNRVLLSEEAFNSDDAKLSIKESTLAEVSEHPDEVTLFIQSGQTSKKWFKKQHQLAKLYHLTVKIIHIY